MDGAEEPTDVELPPGEGVSPLCPDVEDDCVRVEFPVGNGDPSLSVDVMGITVVTVIGGRPTGEIVSSTVEDCADSLDVDEAPDALIEVLVTTGDSVAEKIRDVDVLTKLELTSDGCEGVEAPLVATDV